MTFLSVSLKMSENNNKKKSLSNSKSNVDISDVSPSSSINGGELESRNQPIIEPSQQQQQQFNIGALNQSMRKLLTTTSTTTLLQDSIQPSSSSSSSSSLAAAASSQHNNSNSNQYSQPKPSSSSLLLSSSTIDRQSPFSYTSTNFPRNFSFIPMATDEEDDELLSNIGFLTKNCLFTNNSDNKSPTSDDPPKLVTTPTTNYDQSESFPVKPQRSWNVKLKNANSTSKQSFIGSNGNDLNFNQNGTNSSSNGVILNSSSLKLLNNLARVNSIPNEIIDCTNQTTTTTSTTTTTKISNSCLNSNTISDENYNFVSVEHADTSFPVFLELWQNRQVCDVIIKVGDQKFYAHRIILCATIPYFYAMFTNDLAERTQTEIVLQPITETEINGTPSLDCTAFELLLRYAYTGTIMINSSNVQSTLIGASFLGLTNVQQACADYLKIRLNVGNVLNVISFAFVLGCESLVTASKRFIYRHFEEISKTNDFLCLEYDDVVDIIDKDELNISGEEIVFQAIIEWIKHDEEKRKDRLPQLLAYVRLPLLLPEYLTDTVMAEKLIRSSLQCRDLVDEAKDFHLLPQRRELIRQFRSRPRFGQHIQGPIYAVGGLTKNGDSMSTVEVYDPHSKRWRMAEAMTMLRSRVGVAVMDGKLYAIGGYNGKERLNTVEVYDSRLKRWNKVTSMCYRRSAVGAAALSGHLFVCGGYDGNKSLNAVERYSAIDDHWELMSSMNFHRSASGVVAFDGYIYALGGHDGMMIFNSVERYDPRTNRWEMVEPMLTRRCRLGVATFGGKIYVCGGYDGCSFLPSAEVFDPNTGKWSLISSMRLNRSRVALVADCGRLFAIGGYDGISNLSSVEMYDIEHDYWEFTSSMVAHEGGVGVGVIPDKAL